MAGLKTGWRIRLRRLPNILRALTWCLLIIVLARPQSGNAQEIIRGQGIDIVLALDISGSMGTVDFGDQHRLAAAKDVIQEFVQSRSFDRIGLVVFARQAFHQVPLTLDYSLFSALMDEVTLASELRLDEGTAIGLGLASAANMLRRSDTPSKVIILLTDGAHNAEGISPIDAAMSIALLNIRVYTIGMASDQPVPLVTAPDGSVQFVEGGLDEATLMEIARITGGRYFRAVELSDLQAVYDQINILEKSDIERQVHVNWRDQAVHILLPLCLGLLILERMLRETVFQTLS